MVRGGLERTISQLPSFVQGLLDQSFIEVVDFIVEHHLRLIQAPEGEIARKSLIEAYIHTAGPQYVFGKPGETRLVRSLRRWGPRHFAAQLLSVHLFNIVSMAVHDEIPTKAPDTRSFELYMLNVEAICCDAVKSAVEAVKSVESDASWARAVIKEINTTLQKQRGVEARE
jgi:hypothetical protein